MRLKRTIFYLGLMIVALLIYAFFDTNQSQKTEKVNLQEDPVYQSAASRSYFYNIDGKLDYLIVAQDVKHYEFDNHSTFVDPEIVLFNHAGVQSWQLNAQRAKLLNNQLDLYQDVDMKSLQSDSKIKQILTQEAHVDLLTKTVTSDLEVTIYGANLKSVGIGMIGYFSTKTAEILKEVKSSFMTNKIEHNE